MAPEGCAGILPIPRSPREHDSVAHLQTSRTQAMAECSRPPQPARTDAVGTSYPNLEPVDSSAPRSAPLSRCTLLRHSSFVRAVCVDALVRICAGALSDDRPYRDCNPLGRKTRYPDTWSPVKRHSSGPLPLPGMGQFRPLTHDNVAMAINKSPVCASRSCRRRTSYSNALSRLCQRQ
jgi:hypothetical protein